MAPKRKAAAASKSDSPPKRSRSGRTEVAAAVEPQTAVVEKSSTIPAARGSSGGSRSNRSKPVNTPVPTPSSTTKSAPKPKAASSPAAPVAPLVLQKNQAASPLALPQQKRGTRSSSSPSRTLTAVTLAEEGYEPSMTPQEDAYAELVKPQGAVEHWLETVYTTMATIGPLFVSIALLCYVKAIISSSEIVKQKNSGAAVGVVYLVVFALSLIFSIVFGLPAILLGRLLESLTYGSRITWEVVILSVFPVLLSGIFYLYHHHELWNIDIMKLVSELVRRS